MLNRLVAAPAEGMPVSMLDLVRDYEAAWDRFSEHDLDDQDAQDPAVAASFVEAHDSMTTAFQALLAARPATAQDQSLRALCLMRRIAEDKISPEDMATFLRSML